MAIAELIGLGLYALQQLGVALGVGAETVALLSRENQVLARAARKTTGWALGLIIISGVLITLAHIVAGESATIMEPAYIFKWVLIAIIVLGGLLPAMFAPAVVGGSWYALFVLHTLAPVTSFFVIAVLYVAWMTLFTLASMLFRLHPAKGETISEEEPHTMKTVSQTTIEPSEPHRPVQIPVSAPVQVRAPVHIPRPTPTPMPRPVMPPSTPPPLPPVPPPPSTTMMPRIVAEKPAPVAPPMNLPVAPRPVDLPSSSTRNIPTTVPDARPKGLAGVMVMPRNPEDLKK